MFNIVKLPISSPHGDTVIRIYFLTVVVLVALSSRAASQTTPTETQTAVFSDTAKTSDTAKAVDPASTSSTESEPKGGSSFGIKALFGAGMITTENFPANSTTASSAAYSIGVFWNWGTDGFVSFAVQPELMYVSEASIVESGTMIPSTEIVTQSVRLPILLKLQLFNRTVVQPSVYAGPSFAYMLNATNTMSEKTTDVENQNAFQTGLAVGIDVTFLRIFLIDIRYNMGFTSIATDEDGNGEVSDTAPSAKMSSFRAGVGLRF